MTHPPPGAPQTLLNEAAELERTAQLCSYAPDKQRLLTCAVELRRRAAALSDAPLSDTGDAQPAQDAPARRPQGFTSLRLPFRWP